MNELDRIKRAAATASILGIVVGYMLAYIILSA